MKSFPVKIQTLWRQAFPGLLLGAVVGRASLWVQGQPFSWPESWPLMAAAAVMVSALYFFQPTLAGAAGLKAMQFWGLRRFVAWADVREVSFARLYFVQPSLRLVDKHGRVYWIARDTRDLLGLYGLVKQHAGAGHPLTRALETPLFKL